MVAAGCAGPGSIPDRQIVTVQHELALPDLVAACTHGLRDEEPDLNGCFEWIGGACHIYMLPQWVRQQRDGNLDGYHRTLGHELHHCRDGYFHGGDRGVPLLRVPGRF